jgi:hypothetical protein
MSTAVSVGRKYYLGPLPTTRAAALATGSAHYATGRPCKRGHTAARYTQTSNCLECQKEHATPNPVRRQYSEARKVAWLTDQRFYLGKPCKQGHSGERYASNGACMECSRAQAKSYSKEQSRAEFFAEVSERSRQLRGD